LPVYSYLFNRQVAWLLLAPNALLCLGFFMSATVIIPYTFAVAVGRPDIASRSNALALFVVIPTTTGLIYEFGLIGAASSWVVYHLFLYAYMIPRICRECLLVSRRSWYAPILRILVLAGVTYGSAWFLVVIPWSYSTLALALSYMAASVIYVLAAFFLIGPDLRDTIRRLPERLIVRSASTVS
jgi:O-antigen/teichoic acid export membrane protein